MTTQKEIDVFAVMDGISGYNVREFTVNLPKHKIIFVGTEDECWSYINNLYESVMNNEPVQRSHCYDSQF